MGPIVADVAHALGADGNAYTRLFAPLVRNLDKILPAFLGSMRAVPVPSGSGGPPSALRGLTSARHLARRFRTEEGRALVAGTAAHSMLPLTAPLSGVFPLLFTALAQRYGWPVVEGGSAAIVDALVAELARCGRTAGDELPRQATGRAATGAHRRARCHPTPASRDGGRLAALALRPARLARYRYGPGVCKVDWALRGPVPWSAESCRQTVTVHVGGTFEEIARSETDVNAGRHPDRPYCLVTQPCVVDPGRAPEGRHTLWAYCHVPNGSPVDMTERIEAQIERFAPGFRDLILDRSTFTAVAAEEHNPSYVGGDINAGAATLAADGLPADRALEPLPYGHEGRLPLLGRDAARGWRARHVRARGGPRCTARPGPDATGDPMRHTVAYAWYRFRRTMRSEMSYFLSVVLLVGAVGGLALGAIEAARSTESSFADLVASSRVPQLFVFDGVINPGIGLDSAYNPRLLRKLSRLPDVERVESTVELNLGPLTPQAKPLPEQATSPVAEASVGGLDFSEDPTKIVDGRMVDPHAADEVVLDAASAKTLGYHVGEEIPVGWVTNAQTTSGNFDPSRPVPVHQRAMVKLVGIVGGQATTLFQDQDSANGQSLMLFTPALTNRLLACCSNDMVSALTLRDGDRHLSAVEGAVKGALPKGLPFVYQESQSIIATADATLRPETIALNVFGGITGIAALLIAGQVISRRVRLRAPELDIARALGADPPMCLCDGLLGSVGAVLLGSLLAGAVAVGLSPLGPLGPVRPFLGVALRPDWTVIGIGVLTLVLVLTGVAVLASFRSLPDRTRNRATRFTSSRVTTAASRAGLPPSAVTGVRFALEPGVGRSSVPVRSAILGAILAVTVVVATVTFGSSLDTLVSHPALYGWNWNYDIDGGGGLGDIPGPAAAKLLDADPLVESWTGIYYSTLTFDGVNVPVMGATPGAQTSPRHS